MNVKKVTTRCVAVTISSVMLCTPIMSTIYAFDGEQKNITQGSEEGLFSESKIKDLKEDFQEKNGNEDKFIPHVEEDGTITEINGARGIIRITDSITGDVTEFNAFEIYENLNQEEKENGSIYDNLSMSGYEDEIATYASTPSLPTGGHTTGAKSDRANLRATREGSKVKFTANNPILGTSSSKTYRKSANNWYSGHTRGYYNSIRGARRSFGTSMSHFTTAGQTFAIAVASNYVKKKQFHPNVTTVSKAIKNMALGVSIGSFFEGSRYLVAYLGEMGVVYSNYLSL